MNAECCFVKNPKVDWGIIIKITQGKFKRTANKIYCNNCYTDIKSTKNLCMSVHKVISSLLSIEQCLYCSSMTQQ